MSEPVGAAVTRYQGTTARMAASRAWLESVATFLHTYYDAIQIQEPGYDAEVSAQYLLDVPSAAIQRAPFIVHYLAYVSTETPRSTATPYLLVQMKSPHMLMLLSPYPAESATKQEEQLPNTYCSVRAAFSAARDETFEDGMESAFSRRILSLVRHYGVSVIETITRLAIHEAEATGVEVCSEALRQLGRIRDRATHEFRLWLLQRGLSSELPQIRDGALLGLATMGDPRAVPYIRQAAVREQYPELQEDMWDVLAELEAMNRGAASTEDQES